ncbi:MAG: Rdx family protein [Myxococcota bacterium]|nr:Rdx family protein [Myxococcota bacterium]
MEAEIKASFSGAEVELIRGAGGIFDVHRDGVLIFSKDRSVCGGFPAEDHMTTLLAKGEASS